jgi:hypothetical protein
VLWHIVRFRFRPDVDQADREALARSMAGLADTIDELRLVRVAPSVDEPDVLGLITGLDDADALAAYRDHPDHLPVVARARELCEEIVRLDVVTDDPADALPRVAP